MTDEFSALEQVEALRRDAGDYAVVQRMEQEEGRTYSWDQRHVRAWEAAESIEAAERLIDRLAGKLVDVEFENAALSARVTQAAMELAQAKHDVWQEGFDRGEQDVLDHERHGWDDSCDVENPYPAPSSPGTGNEASDG